MKPVFLPCLLLAALASCQKEALVAADADAYPQTWQLVEMRGQVPNSVKTEADLPMQETYVFQADSTFTKTRQQNGQLTEARGVFTFQDLSDGRYMVLTYAAASPIIGACTTEPKETLALKSNDVLTSTWQNCDGPGLEYRKIRANHPK